MLRSLLQLTLLLLAATALGSCWETVASPDAPPADTLAIPKRGSAFDYHIESFTGGNLYEAYDAKQEVVLDSAGRGAMRWRIDTRVLSAPVNVNYRDQLTLGVQYRADGNVDVFPTMHSSQYVPRSLPLPIVSRADTVIPALETSQSSPGTTGGGHTITITMVTMRTNYLGRDTIQVGTERLVCEHFMTDVRQYSVPKPGLPPPPATTPAMVYVSEYWFAPKIGFFVKIKDYQPAVRNFAILDSYTLRTLKSYDLK